MIRMLSMLALSFVTFISLTGCSTRFPTGNYRPQLAELSASDPKYVDVTVTVLPVVTADDEYGDVARESGLDLSAIRAELLAVLASSGSFKRISVDEAADYELAAVVVGASDLFANVIHLNIHLRASGNGATLLNWTIVGGGFGAMTQAGSIKVIGSWVEAALPGIRRALQHAEDLKRQ